MHHLLALLALSLCFSPAAARPPRAQQRQQQQRRDYFGAYNECGYEVWPWPRSVQCRVSGHSLRLQPEHFRIAASEHSRAANSSVLLAAFERYQALIFNQPTRISRGKFVEPQFHFDDEAATGVGATDEVGGMELLTALVVTVLEECDAPCVKTDASDETYEIEVSGSGGTAYITSPTVWGALYALDTFSQLVEGSPNSGPTTTFMLRDVPLKVQDAPRYPWRGILLDTSNHFLQLSTLLRLLDAMSAAKLNVLHWHIMDSYAFPFASELFPDLAAAGKWTAGNAAGQGKDSVYTHDMVRTVVQYATERGVRVIPEVDMPGHGYSWGLSGALSSITTACPGYTDELGHVDDVPLDPTKTLTYEVVLGLLSELTGLFPDTFLHLGGDEVKYGCWNESVSIKTWMIEHGLPSDDFYGLEQWFFKEVGSFTTEKLKRKVVAWEEVFFDDSGGTDGAHGSWIGSEALPAASTVVEVWTGPDYVKEATRHGYDAILAYGWYLDRQNPVDGEETWFFGDSWAQMYLVDPEPVSTNNRSPLATSTSVPQAKQSGKEESVTTRVGKALGGEISMWTEQVDDLNIESQMWPRAGAAAERLWSGQDVTDLAAAATRLSAFRCRLVSRFHVRAGPIWSDYCSATADYFTDV